MSTSSHQITVSDKFGSIFGDYINESVKSYHELWKISHSAMAQLFKDDKKSFNDIILKEYEYLKSKYTDVNAIYQSSSNLIIRNTQLIDSTSSIDINRLNKDFLSALDSTTESFVIMLKQTDFEDGVESEPITIVEGYLDKNSSVTCNWLSTIYSNYTDDPAVLTGLLRIIGMIRIENEMDCLLPLVIAGLNHVSSETQEAAIMVIEEWRTLNCWKALSNINFSSDWIREYAETVKNELESELGIC